MMNFNEQWDDTRPKASIAVQKGDIDLLQRLIKSGCPVDAADNRGWRPLHEAAADGDLSIVKELLKQKRTDINWTTHEGETALLLACKRRRKLDSANAVELLLSYGADPNIPDNEEESPLLAAARARNTEAVKVLVNSGDANINCSDYGGWYPIHEAAMQDNLEMLMSLLTANAKIDVSDECGMTPIFTAAQFGSENCLQELLHAAKDRGQNYLIDKGATDWATPLMIAAQQGFVTCMRILIDNGANPNLQTSDRVTALHLAVQSDRHECLELLLQVMSIETFRQSFNPTSGQIPSNLSPIHLAIEWQSHKCLEILLRNGFSPDSINERHTFIPLESRTKLHFPNCETALSFAVFKKNDDAIKLLLEHGASVNPPIPQLLHPVISAIQNPTLEQFSALLEASPDVNYIRPGSPTNELLMVAIFAGIPAVKALLHAGCDPNKCFNSNVQARNIFVETVTAFAAKVNEPCEVVKLLYLLLQFVIITSTVKDVFQCLQVALQEKHPECYCEMNWEALMAQVDNLSSLKRICVIKIRRHLYKLYGVNFPNVTDTFLLPEILKEHISGHELC